MLVIYTLAASFLAVGFYLVAARFLRLPTFAHTRVMANGARAGSERRVRSLPALLLALSARCAVFIRLDDYKRRILQASLDSAGLAISPEAYLARAVLVSLSVLLLIVPAYFILPILIPVVLVAAGLLYYKERTAAARLTIERKEEIEKELVRFTATVTQELKHTNDVYAITESYLATARPVFKKELTVLLADMRSGNPQRALRRLEARVNSPQLNQVAKGLAMALEGSECGQYFETLCDSLISQERQRLRLEAQKRPAKVSRYSAAIMVCFILTYLVILGMEIIETMSQFF